MPVLASCFRNEVKYLFGGPLFFFQQTNDDR